MKLFEITNEKLPDVKTWSPEKIADHHNVPLNSVLKQLDMGIKVEKEHTKSAVTAREIALDHLKEIPDYYTRLAAMEDKGKKNVQEGEVIPLRRKNIPTSKITGEEFVKFEARPITIADKPQKKWQLVGIRKDGRQENVKTTTEEDAKALAGTYNKTADRGSKR